MLNIIKEYRHYFATLFLVVIPLVALNAGGKAPADLYWFDKFSLALSNPVQKVIHSTIVGGWELVENYFLLLEVKENNQVLAEENRRLLAEIAGFREMALENDRLKSLVDFSKSVDGQKILAQVVARDVSPEFKLVRLNKGSREGVQNGMTVISLEGVVGRIIRVGTNFSDVLTLLDGSSAIDGLVQRNRVRGIVEGKGNNLLSLKYLRRTDDVREGDIIISSGIGGLFPKGQTIGRVTGVRKLNYGITQNVEISPAVDFSKLEEVAIVDPPKVPLENAVLNAESVIPIPEAEKKE